MRSVEFEITRFSSFGEKMIESFLLCANFGFLMYVCGKTVLTGCGDQKVLKDYTSINGFGK